MKCPSRCRSRNTRQGVASLEAILTLAVTLSIAMGMLVMGAIACRHLYHVLSVMVGSPYL